MKTVSLFFLFFVTLQAYSQIVNIPDANFKFALLNYDVADFDGDGLPDGDVDTNDDGEIQLNEAEAVFGLWVGNQFIVSMEGIQSFSNLEVLDCGQNYSLATLDVSQNSELRELYCFTNQLSILDVTENLNLEILDCAVNHIGTLDVSQNENLVILYCEGNVLSSLNVSENLNLVNLRCSYNPLHILDVTNNFLLERLWCDDTGLTELDVSQNPNLRWLFCIDNLLAEIDVTQNPNLQVIGVRSNMLTNLSFNQNPILEEVHCSANQINNIDISQNPLLDALQIDQNQLTSLDITQNPNLLELECQENLLSFLNMSNGSNTQIRVFDASNNPDLLCIQIDNETYANSRICGMFGSDWCKDPWAVYSEVCALGMEEYLNDNLTISPNPVTDIFQIENKGNAKIATVTLYDALGRLVLVETEDFDRVDVSSLNSGVYFLKITTDLGEATKKLIKK